jgi:hypothetical protein
MATAADISALYQELTEALAENSVGLARRGRLARAALPSKSVPGILNMNIFWQSNCIQTMESNSKRWSLGPALAVRPT